MKKWFGCFSYGPNPRIHGSPLSVIQTVKGSETCNNRGKKTYKRCYLQPLLPRLRSTDTKRPAICRLVFHTLRSIRHGKKKQGNDSSKQHRYPLVVLSISQRIFPSTFTSFFPFTMVVPLSASSSSREWNGADSAVPEFTT